MTLLPNIVTILSAGRGDFDDRRPSPKDCAQSRKGHDRAERFTAPSGVAAECDTTIAYYDQNWETYVAKTKDVDMSDIRERFVKRWPKGPRVLGAGARRDSQAFVPARNRTLSIGPLIAVKFQALSWQLQGSQDARESSPSRAGGVR